MRIGFIGDVHGHERELIAMLGQLEEHGVDEIVSLGDVVDRGPRSLACLHIMSDWDFLPRNSHQPRPLKMVKGNHEDAYVRICNREAKPGRQIVEAPEDRALSRRFSRADVTFMRSLPTSLYFPEIDVTALHGGVTPHMAEIDDFALRVRYLDDRHYELRGTMPSDVYWAEVYDGRFGLILCGHESHLGPSLYENALALDGEGFRRLHAAVISNEEGADWLTCFTLHYGSEQVRQVEPDHDPVRLHSPGGRALRNASFRQTLLPWG